MYMGVLGLDKDIPKAMPWLAKAIKAGNAEAAENLAGLYMTGDGVAADRCQAGRYFRTAVDLGRPEALRWVLAHAPVDGLRQLARLRLARVLLASGDSEGAITLLDGADGEAFADLYAEVRGDAALAKGDSTQARRAYTQALGNNGSGAGSLLLQMKLENLGGSAG